MESTKIVESSSSSYILFSLKHIVQFIYFEKIVSIILWEELIEKMTSFMIDQPSAVVQIYIVFKNAIANFGQNEVSQIELIRQKEKERTLDEIIEYFSNQITNDQFIVEALNFETVSVFKDLIKKINNINLNVNETDNFKINDDDDDDDDDSSNDEFNNSINLILNKNNKKTKKGKKHVSFEQIFQISTDGKRKWLKTPGEKGMYMIEIKVTDTRDIVNVNHDEWWKKVSKKVIVLAESTNDPLFVSVKNVLKMSLDKIKNISNVKSGSYTMEMNRFKPY